MDLQAQDIKKDLAQIVGEQYVSDNIFERVKSALDPMPYHIKNDSIPYVVVLPKNKEEISEIMKYANKNKISVFVRCSGTQLNGASRPHAPGIVLNTKRINSFEIIEKGGYFECEPGVRCKEMADELKALGYWLPVYPGSQVIASMGGLISNNTSGHLTDTYTGKPGDYVHGLEVVLPTGEIIETGTVGLRKPAGTDLTKFFVGGDGLMGIIVRIRMRLLPLLPRAYGVAIFKDLEALAGGVQRMYLEKRPVPIFMEFMSKTIADIGFQVKGMEAPPGPVLLTVTEGLTKKEAEYKVDEQVKSFKKEKVIVAYRVTDMNEWEKLWGTREVIGSYIMQVQRGKLITSELSGNLAELVEIMRDAESFNEGLSVLQEIPTLLFGHIGALAIHASFLLPADWEDDKLKKATDELFQRETEINFKYRTCGGEWGQFAKRTPFFIKRYGQFSYDLVKNIKAVFDPNNILNPGIFEGHR
ncbi:FAD-binding oxidoreductase [Desulfoscipio sp. XC116]|uniref:FAD-binding oxidoreductase n=1 Tax=Desulfoscipio sp. XC116 TaxID=3144975 RepID=UPI00325C1896